MDKDKLSQTQRISNLEKPIANNVNDVLKQVYNALTDKGYSPSNQIVCYILSGDPTYITATNNARSLITKIERDEILEEIVNYYLKNNL